MTYNFDAKPKHVIIQFPPAEWHPNDTAVGSTLKMRHTLAAGETRNTSAPLSTPHYHHTSHTQASAKEKKKKKKRVFSPLGHISVTTLLLMRACEGVDNEEVGKPGKLGVANTLGAYTLAPQEMRVLWQ